MTPDTQLATTQAQSPAQQIISQALATGVAPETLQKLLDVRREWEADEARKAFNLAVSQFQRRCPIVEKADKAHDKHYAALDRIWRTIRPLLTELGLSVTWEVTELRDNGTVCHVEGRLAHELGHSQPLRMDLPLPDVVRGQNKAQQMGSAQTYAKRYALCGALGIVTGEDDDGRGAGSCYISTEQARELRELLEVVRGLPDFNESSFWRFAGAECVEEVEASRFAQIMSSLDRKLKPQGKAGAA